MCTFTASFLLGLLFIYSASAISNFLRHPEICGSPACRHGLKFGFLNSTKYEYQYSISTKTMFDGGSKNTSNLQIFAKVIIKFKTPCEGILELSNPVVKYGTNDVYSDDPEKSEMFASALSKYVLRFSFDDGSIKQICPDVDEPIWVLNMKKGILSSIQNTMERFDVDQMTNEQDVNGDCLVGFYFKEVNGTTLAIDKKTDLKSCVNRYQIYSIIPMTPYVFQKKYHKWTPLNSFLNCTQYLDHKVYSSVVCVEEHAFQPFRDNGAKTYSKSQLYLENEQLLTAAELEEMKNPRKVERRDSLLFDHRRPKKVTHDNLLQIKEHIKSLCTLHEEKFQPVYPDTFNRFIHIARDLSSDALAKLYDLTPSLCSTGRKHMLDALPYIRSRASTKVMVEVILKKEVPDDIINEWLMAMAFFPRPDLETIDYVSRLLFGDQVNQQTLLSITTMIYGYCMGYKSCETQSTVKKSIEKLEMMFNRSCLIYNENDEELMVFLKAVGNSGVLTSSMESSLRACLNNNALPTEVKLEAIRAHRRLSCETNKDSLLGIFQNQTIPEELRIAAYLQLMNCPSYPILKAVKNALAVEEFNQVGSFVWSHLNTVIKSSQTNRVEIQAMLQDEELSDKFNLDPRKFSRSYETSVLFNDYGLGGSTEVNVIFTRASYIPRNIVFNFTLSVFGENLNIMELDFRLQGLEKYAEKFFYGDALFSKDNIVQAMKYLRVIRSQPNKFQYLMNSIPFKKIMDSIKISCSVKMFGNELRFYRINGHNDFVKFLELFNPMALIRKLLSGHEMKFDRSVMWADTSYIMPMSTGLPMKLNTIGTAAFNIDAMGLVNSTEFSSKIKLDLEGKLNPSVGINVEGVMEVDAFVTTSGVKFKGSVFTSTALDGSFKWENYKFLKLTFHLPMLKSDILHAETQLLLVTNDKEFNLEDVDAQRFEPSLCSSSFIDDTVGLKLCGSTSLPNSAYLWESPMYLFSRPLKFEFFLTKSDPTATTYIIEYHMETSPNNKSIILVKLDTPGSVTRRGLSAVIELDTESQNLTLMYQSTLSHVIAHGFYKNTPSEKMANFGLDINGKKHIDVQLGVEVEEGKYGKTYFPKVLFAINGKRIVFFNGTMKWVAKKGISQCDIDLHFETQKFSTVINGYLRLSEASFATNVKMDYKFNEGNFETVRIELKIGNKSTKFLTFYNGELQLESTAYPDINMVTTMNFNRAQNHIDWAIDMRTNPFVTDEARQLRVTLSYQEYTAFALEKMNTSLAIKKPKSDIDFGLGISKHQTPGSTNLMAIIRYATKKDILVNLDVRIPHGTLFYFESRLVVMLHGARNPLSLFSKVFEKNQRDYDIELLGTWFSGHNVSVKGMYQDRSSMSYNPNPVQSHSLKLLARSPLFTDVLFIGRVASRDFAYDAKMEVEHNDIKYGVLFKYMQSSYGIYESFGEVNYNQTVYSMNTLLDVISKNMILELHFDRFRDVHISLHGVLNKTYLNTGVDVQYDANRDPSKKISFLLKSKSQGRINREGKCVIEYPGKVITTTFLLQHKFTDYILSFKMEYSPKDIFDAYFQLVYDIPENGVAEFRGRVDTPFINFEHIALSYQMKLETQRLTSNGSLAWQKGQRADVEISYYYNLSPENTQLLLVSMLNSTIPNVNSMKGIFRHQQMRRQFASEIIIQTNVNSTIQLGASGGRLKTQTSHHYNGSLAISTPFELVKRASAVGELNIFPEKFEGKLKLIGNSKKYTTVVRGYMKVITESQLTFQIGTPLEKYKAITGKLIFSATNKTFFADLKSCVSCASPASLGAEIIYIYHNTSNFNLKLELHSSISRVKKLLVAGKRDPSTIDARFSWNNLILGIIGRSHFQSWKDLEYALQLFTPIDGYNKASAIAKLMLEDQIDFEASLNVAKKKVGLKIQSKYYPDENFAVIDLDSNLSQEPENTTGLISVPPLTTEDLYFGNVFWRGYFQLDTPMYPTVYGLVRVLKDEDEEYSALAFFSFPFGQLRLHDDLTFKDYLNLKNNIEIMTSCACLESVRCDTSLSGIFGSRINMKLQTDATLRGVLYEASADGLYDFVPISEDSGKEGRYHFMARIKSPLKMLNFTFIDAYILMESPLYSGNTTFLLNNSSLTLDGTIELDDSFFDANIGMKIESHLLVLPDCRINVFKDFTDFEKKIEVGLALPNERGDALVKYGIEGLWHYDPPNFFKSDLEIITPYSNVGTIKGSVQYVHNLKDARYSVETFLRYSKQSEVRASCNILKETISFSITSSSDPTKKVFINGTLKNNVGVKSLQVIMSSDKQIKLVGYATIIPDRPIMVEVKLYQSATNEALMQVLLTAYKKGNGHTVNVLILKSGHTIRILGDYTPLYNVGRKLDITVGTTYEEFESLNVSALLFNEGYSLMAYNVKGATRTKWLTVDAIIKGDLSFHENGGVSRIKVESSVLNLETEIMWMMEKFRNVVLDVFGRGTHGGIDKELAAHLHFWNEDDQFEKFSLSTDLNYNRKTWLMTANATLIWPEWNDLTFVSFAVLPEKIEEVHTVMVHYLFDKDLKYGAHILKYFRHESEFDFLTTSEYSVEDTHTSGAFLVKTKQHRIHDKFNLQMINSEYHFHNVLESTNMKEVLTIDMNYVRPKNRIIRMNIYYPHPKNVLEAIVDFDTLSNFQTNLNCSTPFKAFPYIQVLIKAVSSRPLYVRLIQAKWPNNSATLNYTHSSNFHHDIQLTEGSVLVDFPLATRHSGILEYTYESSDTKATGRSSLSYNGQSLVSGNYSRSSEISERATKDNIAIHANNKYLPIGIIYNHRSSQKFANKPIPYSDVKHVELFKLTDEIDNYHLFGEYSVEENEKNQLVTYEGKYGERRAVFKKFTQGDEQLITNANLTFYPNISFGYGLEVFHKPQGHEIQFNISYPRRHFVIEADYFSNSSAIITSATVHPNTLKNAKSVSASAKWYTVTDDGTNTVVLMIGHPSFEKNVTFALNYAEHNDVLLNFDSTFEYSIDDHKKLTLNGTVKNESQEPKVRYVFEVLGAHPASRLKIAEYGYFEIRNRVFEVDTNMTYKRSYLPLMFWYTNLKVDLNEKLVQIERESLKEVSFAKAKYGKVGSKHYINSTLLCCKNVESSSIFFLDLENSETELIMNFTPDASEKLLMKGWYRDNRHAKLDVWRTYDDIAVYDVNFFAVLNHSRMLTSHMTWRPDIRNDIMGFLHSSSTYIWNYALETAEFWTSYIKTETIDTLTDIWVDAKPIIKDFLDDVKDTEDLKEDFEWIKSVFRKAYEDNEFYVQDIYESYESFAEEMSFKVKMANVPKLFNELWELMGETGNTIRESILWLVETVRKVYDKLVEIAKGLMTGETIKKISEYLKMLTSKYDKLIKDMHIGFIHYIEHLFAEASEVVHLYWMKVTTTIEPAFISFAHYIETVVYEAGIRTLRFLYEKQSELLQSAVFQKNSNLTKDLEIFYQDLTKNDFFTNVKKYAKMFYDVISQKYLSSIPFGTELKKIGTEIATELTELYKLPFVSFTFEFVEDVYHQIKSTYNFLRMNTRIERLVPFLYSIALDFTRNALDNEIINHESRTKFIFEPGMGQIILEQKLPVPWHSFNDTPNFEEVPEYKILKRIHSVLTPSNASFWFYYYKFAPFLDPNTWLPPYDGHAVIIGSKYFRTFDGEIYDVNAQCSHLLAADFVGKKFALFLRFIEGHEYLISLLAHDHLIDIDLAKNLISVQDEPTPLHLPFQIEDLYVTALEGVASIRSKAGFSLLCNLKYDVCTFSLSGWFFGKTAGLLGTLDNEPVTDFLSSNGEISKDIDSFVDSWTLGRCRNNSEFVWKEDNPANRDSCKSLFQMKTSSLSSCYPIVDPQPYKSMCMKSHHEFYDDEICTSAQAYIETCKSNYIPLKIPSSCVECSLNHDSLSEGELRPLDRATIQQSTDVVFIVEAKECNQYMRERKMVNTFITILTKELQFVGLTNNRYAVVTFGGDGVFDSPESVIFNNHIFTNEKLIAKFFEQIKSGNGNSDIFRALRFATKLHYRPGVSKTFILIPCSDCDLSNMTVEYSAVNQAFLEQNITLHVLMNADFDLEKLGVNKMFYGLDSERAYTKKDFKVLKGDSDLRRQIKLTKSMMGYCTSLALGTNGTIFTGKRMGSENIALVKKFSSMFARRIAATALPGSCQNCECTANEHGIEFLECLPCSIPIPAYADFDFSENSTLSFFQALDYMNEDGR